MIDEDLIPAEPYMVAELDGERVAAVALGEREGYYTLRADFTAPAGARLVLVRTSDLSEIDELDRLAGLKE
jgi:hypothetical protein